MSSLQPASHRTSHAPCPSSPTGSTAAPTTASSAPAAPASPSSFTSLPLSPEPGGGPVRPGSGYKLPPREIADIVDAPSQPSLSYSPDRKLVSRRTLPYTPYG